MAILQYQVGKQQCQCRDLIYTSMVARVMIASILQMGKLRVGEAKYFEIKSANQQQSNTEIQILLMLMSLLWPH